MVKEQQKGFSIIEVVLVLAIAGLIFLMVFIALPALQRSQRDTARRNDASTVAAAVNTYKSNNRNSLSGLTVPRLVQYIDQLDQYDNVAGTFTVSTTGTSANPEPNRIVVHTGAKCGAPAPAPGAAFTINRTDVPARAAAVVVKLENNGGATTFQNYCVDV